MISSGITATTGSRRSPGPGACRRSSGTAARTAATTRPRVLLELLAESAAASALLLRAAIDAGSRLVRMPPGSPACRAPGRASVLDEPARADPASIWPAVARPAGSDGAEVRRLSEARAASGSESVSGGRGGQRRHSPRTGDRGSWSGWYGPSRRTGPSRLWSPVTKPADGHGRVLLIAPHRAARWSRARRGRRRGPRWWRHGSRLVVMSDRRLGSPWRCRARARRLGLSGRRGAGAGARSWTASRRRGRRRRRDDDQRGGGDSAWRSAAR